MSDLLPTGQNVDFQLLRDNKWINRLMSVDVASVTDPDWYRIVVSVQEANADFQAFVVKDLPNKPQTMLGYPVYYADGVKKGEVWGGMWSDWKDGKPRHASAFCLLTVKELLS